MALFAQISILQTKTTLDANQNIILFGFLYQYDNVLDDITNNNNRLVNITALKLKTISASKQQSATQLHDTAEYTVQSKNTSIKPPKLRKYAKPYVNI